MDQAVIYCLPHTQNQFGAMYTVTESFSKTVVSGSPMHLMHEKQSKYFIDSASYNLVHTLWSVKYDTKISSVQWSVCGQISEL